ncbi:polysaccharide deacetylase family protein [Natronolimnohabitans innermongolicus]|nr:polysaccharide deacetylase family protein [Natronolimnohabitans innermongolicus]
MRRRIYLATAAAASIAGCMDFVRPDAEDDEPDDEPDDGDDPPALEAAGDDGTIDEFADLEAWTVVSGNASLVDEDAGVGETAVRLAAGSDDDGARMVRELPEPLDCSEASPGLAVAPDDTVTVLLQLFDDSGNVLDFRTTVHEADEPRRCNFGIDTAADDVDPTDITTIHVAFFAGEDAEQELLLDDLHLVPRPETGLVTIQFDNGHESIYDEGFPVLEEYGYPATAFVPTDLIRALDDHEGERFTEAQLEELSDAGWTIASHTANAHQLPDLEPDDQADQLAEAREWLEAEGYDDGAGYVSYPVGRYDGSSLEYAAETYDLGFELGYPVQGYVADPARYPRVVDPEVEDAEELLERTAELGGITSLCYYALEGDVVERFEETMALLADHVENGDLEVITLADIESEYVFDADGE